MRLTTDKLRKLGKNQFERFCRALLDAENIKRFEPGTVELNGPSPDDTPDGGRDIHAVVRGDARSAHYALLPDVACEAIYSCKSHKDSTGGRAPDGWKTQVRADVDPRPSVYDAKKSQRVADFAAHASATKPGLRKLLQSLTSGAQYRVLLNVGAADAADFRAEIATRLRTRAAVLFGGDASVLDEQIWVHDANQLVRAFELRPFTLEPDLLAALGGDDENGFRDFKAWTRVYERERRPMSYVPDAARVHASTRLRSLIDGQDYVLRITGAPGVGKTRVVHEFFREHPGDSARIRFTEGLDALQAWLDAERLREQPDVIIVADEIPSSRAGTLARSFVRQAQGTRAKLILIGTQGEKEDAPPEPIVLTRIDEGAFARLVEGELDASPAAGDERTRIVEVVIRLSQGYPLFAMWLARALAEEPSLLNEPGAGLTDEIDPWSATRLVLAGRGEETQAEIRGKSLILALLASSDDWDAFSDDDVRGFEKALDADWVELRRAARACEDRGLLRVPKRLPRYVSPRNLERLVLNHFFSGPDGPLPPSRLRRFLGTRVDRLLSRAQAVSASAHCRRCLALAILRGAIGELRTRGIAPSILHAVARECPGPTIEALAQLYRGTDAVISESIRPVLDHLRHRALTKGSFQDLEDLLFRLDADDAGLTPHRDWDRLFSSVLDLTHQPFDDRFRLLERRASSIDPNERRRALGGIAAVISPPGAAYSPGIDDVDGPFEEPTWDQVRLRQGKGWALLLDRCADQHHEVANAARTLMAQEVREGLVSGGLVTHFVERLTEVVGDWTSMQRNRLSEGVRDALCYDEPLLGERLPTVKELERRLAPKSFREHLLARVGRWDPVGGPVTLGSRTAIEREGDEDVARAAIRSPDEFFACADWLDSEGALRARQFALVLGEVDEERDLLEGLILHASLGRLVSFFGGYLAGWAERDPGGFDAWLDEGTSGGFNPSLVLGLVGASGTDRRAAVLVRLLDTGDVDATWIRGIGYWRWADNVRTDLLDRIALSLGRRPEAEARFEALGLVSRRVRREPATVPSEIEALVLQLVDAAGTGHLRSTGDRAWVDLVTWLVERGRAEVFEIVVAAAADSEGYSHQAERALEKLLASGHAAEVWRAIAERIEADPLCTIRLDAILSRTTFHDTLPLNDVLSWMGSSDMRGAALARLARPYSPRLDPLAVALIEQFGAESLPARVLATRVGSTPHPVHSLASFHDAQARNAEAWAKAASGEVALWASYVAARERERAMEAREEEQLLLEYG